MGTRRRRSESAKRLEVLPNHGNAMPMRGCSVDKIRRRRLLRCLPQREGVGTSTSQLDTLLDRSRSARKAV